MEVQNPSGDDAESCEDHVSRCQRSNRERARPPVVYRCHSIAGITIAVQICRALFLLANQYGRDLLILNFSLRAPHSAPRISLHHNPQSASLFDDVQGRGAGGDIGGGNPVNPRVLHHLRRRERFGQPFGFDGKIICFTASEQI
jgi:hypothetical protein